jgi:hypothetical protein
MFALPDSTPEILGLKTAVLKPVLMGSASMRRINLFFHPTMSQFCLGQIGQPKSFPTLCLGYFQIERWYFAG